VKLVQENDAEAAVREVSRILRAPSTQGNLPKVTEHSAASAVRVDIAGVLGRIRTPAFAIEYRQVEASTLALQTKTDQQLATLRSLERACAPDSEVAAASRTLGESEYAYDYACWRLRMKALTALAGAPSPVAQLTWPERIAIGFHRDRSMRDYTDEDVVVIAANVQTRLSPPSA
jgi:hypothetical protein